MYSHILFSLKDAVAYIDLNRPDVFNALHAEILTELNDAFKSLNSNDEVRAVVLSGGNCKAFCSGADLKNGLKDPDLGKVLANTYAPLIQTMVNFPKPIICKLNGVAAGAGMSLALACDMIIADENTYMTELFVGIGLMPDAGSMYFLPRILGIKKTFELCATGRKVFMPEAAALGLINKCVPTDELDANVEVLLGFFRNAATFSICEMKNVLHRSVNASFDEVMALEAAGQTKCGYTQDFKEGVAAFLEKRPAKFIGK